ncbi:hypothetical protein KAT51_08615, partial [bacterium]|nr:hypothetical protein [bacterium]
MDPRAIFLGLFLAIIGIFFGYQAYFFLRLFIDKEIGGVRCGFLFLTLIGSLIFVVTHLNSPFSIPVALWPLTFWGFFYIRDKS